MKRLALLPVAALVLAACGSGGDAESGDTVTVVASFYPAAFVAERVGGDLVEIESLTSPGGEAHDLELTPKQIIAVREADVVVTLSDFQHPVDAAVAEADRADGTTVDLAEDTRPLEPTDAGGHEDHEHDDGHDHGADDPHVWLYPLNLVPAAEATAAALAQADPDNAATYEANASALIADLRALDDEFGVGLGSCERSDIVTAHAAFAHLAAAYSLHQVPVAGIDPQDEPTAADIARLSDLVDDLGITTVFTEPLSSGAVAETVAREAGVTTAVLDPIESAGDSDYLSLMRDNLEALRTANGCA